MLRNPNGCAKQEPRRLKPKLSRSPADRTGDTWTTSAGQPAAITRPIRVCSATATLAARLTMLPATGSVARKCFTVSP